MLDSNQANIKGKHKIFLVIGNSRLHWALLVDSKLDKIWDTKHILNAIKSKEQLLELFSIQAIEEKGKISSIPIFIASVVLSQAKLWQEYPDRNFITLKDIKLKNIYPTLGIDRALAVWGGGETYGYPCLVIDGGTALTFTGINKQKQLVGGAILPGLRSQFLTLNQKTAALPQVELPSTLPATLGIRYKGCDL